MLVCNCIGVTEKQVKAAINDGCSSLRDLRNELGVASSCGCCAQEARDLLKTHRNSNQLDASSLVRQFLPKPMPA